MSLSHDARAHSAVPDAAHNEVGATARVCALPGSPLELARTGIDACVHCGFCLQACPTYLAIEDENDSPRGRILLMRELVEGRLLPTDDAVQTHIDRCLGCRACETACPSGVPYGRLLEATRATLRAAKPAPAVARAVLWTFARPRLLALVLAGARLFRATRLPALLGRVLGGRAGFALAMLDATRVPAAIATLQRGRSYAAPSGTAAARGTTVVLTGCVMEGLFAATNRATERVLAANGYALVTAPAQRCCGALHAHAGDLDAARRLARVNIAAFEESGAEFIAVNSAGCGAMIKEYGHLLADDEAWAGRAERVSARARDVSEMLVAAGPRPGAPVALDVTYDAPCHLQHAQRIVYPPLAVLSAAGLKLVPLEDADQCCGSAGIYNLIEPEVSDAVLEAKLGRIRECGADFVATGNPGCLMQIGAGLRRSGSAARAVHPIDLLDASYALASREAPPAR